MLPSIPSFALPTLSAFAVRAIASLDVPSTNAPKKRLRTALVTTLEAAGVETEGFGSGPKVANADFHEHRLVVWYDVACDALRVFAPSEAAVDETTALALDLLQGEVHVDLARLPIEDLDAVVRVLALMSAAGDDAADLHAALVAPNAHRYDDDFVAPTAEDLEALWGTWARYYVGGSSAPLGRVNAWIARAHAFGTGPLPAARPSGTQPVGENDRTA